MPSLALRTPSSTIDNNMTTNTTNTDTIPHENNHNTLQTQSPQESSQSQTPPLPQPHAIDLPIDIVDAKASR